MSDNNLYIYGQVNYDRDAAVLAFHNLWIDTVLKDPENPVADKKIEWQQRNGERNGNAKLTQAQADKIHVSTLPNRTLANQYGVTIRTILKIKRGETWQRPSI